MSGRPISAAYLERKLRAISGVAGDNPLPDLKDLTGLITLESDRPEWRLAGYEVLWAAFSNTVAVVAETGHHVIFNPLNSGVVAVVERMVVTQADAELRWLQVGSSDILTNTGFAVAGGTLGIRDTRALSGAAGLTQNTATRLFSGTLTAAEITSLNANGLFDLFESGAVGVYGHLDEREYVISPGYGLAIVASGANLPMISIVHGYERPLEGKFEMK